MDSVRHRRSEHIHKNREIGHSDALEYVRLVAGLLGRIHERMADYERAVLVNPGFPG